MLVLSRKVGERIVVGDNVRIVVNRITGNRVSIGIEAPADVKIVRGELEPFADALDDQEAESSTPGSVSLATIELDSAYFPRVAR
jgi:carbon storage regulator